MGENSSFSKDKLNHIDKKIVWILGKIHIMLQWLIRQILKGSIRNILTINSLLKLLFLYSVTVLCIIVSYFDFSPGVFKKSSARKVAIYAVENRIGEHQAYIRTLRALKKLGFEYVGAAYDENLMNYISTRHFHIVAAYIINKICNPDVNITLTHHVTILPPGYNLIYLNVPDVLLYNLEGKFLKKYQHLENYDGYIDLYSFSNGDNKLLKEVLHNYDKDNVPIFTAYLAQDEQKFIAPESYNNMVITGSMWGCNRGSYRFQDALQKLAQDKLFIAYGQAYAFDYLGEAYKGNVDRYGPATEMLITLQRKEGIALVIHSLEHLLQGLPTSRFAEAIMSGSVMVVDNNSFIRKFFGDNVLYFDSFKGRDEIYEQLKSHIIWIRSHQKEASIMTKNAYDIFVKNLTLEIQLQKLMEQVDAFRASR